MSAAQSSRLSAQSVFHRIWSECPSDTNLKLPWETGFWKEFFSGPAPPKDIKDWKAVEPPLFVPGVSCDKPDVSKKCKRSQPETWHHIVRAGAEQGWKDQREADFQVSLRRWHDVLLGLPSDIAVVNQFLQLRTVTERLRMLRDIFWKKAPGTLRKRVNSFLRFTANLALHNIPFPGTEADLYSFLDNERNNGAPASRSQSIIQSLLFVQHVIGVPELAELTTSRRCLGVTGRRETGPRRQADPFRLTELQTFHLVLSDVSRDLWDRCLAGMILLTVYCRSRWNDLQQAEEMFLDRDETGSIAYAELKISEHKTKHSSSFRDIFMHACAPGLGVVEGEWISTWIQVRTALGISFDRGHPTMPAPLEEGGVSIRPLSTAEMKQWTALLLSSSGVETGERRITSHSCKCTLLSWCSKRGLPWEDRLVLGGHTSTVRSAMVYSRDNLGRPLRLLEKMLTEVRCGVFLPDATRSGRFPGRIAKPFSVDADCDSEFSYEPSLGFGDAVEEKPIEFSDDPETVGSRGIDLVSPADSLQAPKVECSETSWSFAGSGLVIDLETESNVESEEVQTTSSSSDESGAELSTARRVMQQPRVPSELKLIQHKKLKTLHLMEAQNNRVMLCGRIAEQSRYANVEETRFDTPCCHVCWRKIKEYS